MANFIQAFNITLGNEGGYANNPNDHGGETYAGVARNFWPKWAGWPIVDQVVAQHPANLDAQLRSNSNLQAAVESFYQENFWDVVGLGALQSQQLADQLFDTAVNMGTGMAARFLQQAINELKPNTVTVDGQVGPHTIEAANAANGEALYNQVIALRRERYLAIIQTNPSQAQFEHSWMSRLTPFNPQLA
ncbi:glycoside hydrolase family 108 protein [Mucilaginibacter lacusdianchii]|uniref:glycoside hydrolase family 108 protein n=1 Tax=Mucilaginibacter lacusdianchii TaxID=2684211 RepID=UPI00131BA2FE|nr:glycosyl hydrolase 108 family protein [Mucilaginibacter sp. JXJ CY 39]